MKYSFLLAVLLSSFAMAYEVPNEPPEPCYMGCTPKMESIYEKFNAAGAPSLKPGFYSGECYHLGSSLNGDVTHYGASLIDVYEGKPYLSTAFAFFFPSNKYADWDLEKARQEFGDEWKTSDRTLTINGPTAVASVWWDGKPAYAYWLRQNPVDGTIYQITYWGGYYLTSFCEFKKQ